MTCFLIDDEPLALEVLETYVSRVPALALRGMFTSPIQALEAIARDQPDLIFLDISMPGLNGLQLTRALVHKPAIVFTTAYSEYAVDGFDLNATDYLLKPITFERFLQAVNKAQAAITAPVASATATTPDVLVVNADYQMVRIRMADILYLEGLDTYVKIYLSTQPRPVITKHPLGQLIEKLPPGDFVRIHRSFAVALRHVERFNRSKVFVQGKELPVGERYADEAIRVLGG